MTSTLEAVRAVAEIPNSDALMTMDRTFSASSFESMHSIDHGSLGVDSTLHQQASDISQDGPWTVYTRKTDPPACYEAKFQPSKHPFPRPPPPHPAPEYDAHGLDTHTVRCWHETLQGPLRNHLGDV